MSRYPSPATIRRLREKLKRAGITQAAVAAAGGHALATVSKTLNGRLVSRRVLATAEGLMAQAALRQRRRYPLSPEVVAVTNHLIDELISAEEAS